MLKICRLSQYIYICRDVKNLSLVPIHLYLSRCKKFVACPNTSIFVEMLKFVACPNVYIYICRDVKNLSLVPICTSIFVEMLKICRAPSSDVFFFIVDIFLLNMWRLYYSTADRTVFLIHFGFAYLPQIYCKYILRLANISCQ